MFGQDERGGPQSVPVLGGWETGPAGCSRRLCSEPPVPTSLWDRPVKAVVAAEVDDCPTEELGTGPLGTIKHRNV